MVKVKTRIWLMHEHEQPDFGQLDGYFGNHLYGGAIGIIMEFGACRRTKTSEFIGITIDIIRKIH